MNRLTLLLAALALGAATSCKPSAGTQTSASRGTIAVSLLTLDNPFFKVIGDNITAEGKKLGYDVIVVSGEKDVARQSNQVKDFIIKKVAAIVLSPCDSKSIGPVIKEANANSIPVITVDIPYREGDAKVATQVATDNYGGGKEAGRAMIEALGPQGGKIVIIHAKQLESCQLRVKGFREVIDAHNAQAAGKIEVVSELEGAGAKDIGYKAAEDAIQANPELRAFFAINDPCALGARGAVEKAGKTEQIRIIGFDGQPEGKAAIRDGKIYADPIQFPDKLGQEVARAVSRYFKGEELPPEILIPTSLYRQADGQADKTLE